MYILAWLTSVNQLIPVIVDQKRAKEVAPLIGHRPIGGLCGSVMPPQGTPCRATPDRNACKARSALHTHTGHQHPNTPNSSTQPLQQPPTSPPAPTRPTQPVPATPPYLLAACQLKSRPPPTGLTHRRRQRKPGTFPWVG